MKEKNSKIKTGFKNHKILWLVLFGFFLVTNLITFYFTKKETTLSLSGSNCGDYTFINSRFACGYKNIIDKKGYIELKTRLNSYIEDKKKEGTADIIAVWFRDLESGPTFGINDRQDFIPASLLKLPLALTILQLAEENPSLLNQTIVFGDSSTPVPNQTFVPSERIQSGKTYSLDELVYHSIVHSDNSAAQLVYEYLEKYHPGELSRVYRDLGILEPGHDLNIAGVNTKGYGSIFRMLYNVSFLNKEMSEKLLGLLVKSDFKDGLMRGVPQNILVANKFGERFLENGRKQLHDCGIIYYPGNPYQLCIMTRGSNFNDLAGIISEISEEVYEEIDSRRID